MAVIDKIFDDEINYLFSFHSFAEKIAIVFSISPVVSRIGVIVAVSRGMMVGSGWPISVSATVSVSIAVFRNVSWGVCMSVSRVDVTMVKRRVVFVNIIAIVTVATVVREVPMTTAVSMVGIGLKKRQNIEDRKDRPVSIDT